MANSVIDSNSSWPSVAVQHNGNVLTGGGGRDGGLGGGGSLMTWINRKSKKSVSTKGPCGCARSDPVKTPADESDGGDS